jgi:predicted O-methyltransferase YrrM
MKEDIIYHLKNPSMVKGALSTELETFWGKNISNEYRVLKPQDHEDIGDFLRELKNKMGEEFSDVDGITGRISDNDAQKLYNFLREERPQKVVETGVCNGFSTAVILKALEENGKGKLYSIDLPDDGAERSEHWEDKGNWVIPPNKEPGWIIEGDLRKRWKLIKGDSNVELPSLLSDLESIDLFIHDSEHSYQTMMLEYCLSWKFLDKNGCLISDDIFANDAFDDFAENQRSEKKMIGSLGLLRKRRKRR